MWDLLRRNHGKPRTNLQMCLQNNNLQWMFYIKFSNPNASLISGEEVQLAMSYFSRRFVHFFLTWELHRNDGQQSIWLTLDKISHKTNYWNDLKEVPDSTKRYQTMQCSELQLCRIHSDRCRKWKLRMHRTTRVLALLAQMVWWSLKSEL